MKIEKYFMPAACMLLVAVFFMLLPDLQHCALKPRGKKHYRLHRADALIMALLTFAYAAAAFTRLGDTAAPQSFVNMENRTVRLRLNAEKEPVTHLMLYTGVGIGNYRILYYDGTELWDLATYKQGHGDVLKWQRVELNTTLTGGELVIQGSGDVWLGEVVALTEAGTQVTLETDTAELVDEQSLCPDKQTFLNSSYFDEIYHVRTAWEYLHGVGPYEITHPPLGKLIISLGISLFGMTPFGWRFSGTLFGVLMLPVLYVFAKKLFGGRFVPAACTALMATDCMHFVQTRIATIDSYAVFFTMLMYLFMYLFISEGRLRDLALCGVCFGLGAASKWTCFYAGGGLAVIWVIWIIRETRARCMRLGGFVKNALFCVVFFVLIPAGIYYLSYIPYGAARGVTDLLSRDYLKMVLDNQEYMFSYHSGLMARHPYSSDWYQWLLDIRPILYYLEYLPDGRRISFGAFVNPVLCWGGLLSLFALGYLAIWRRDRVSGYIVIGYLAQLLPWILVQRPIFAYHYFACTVFLALSLGRCFDLTVRNQERGRLIVSGFVLLSFAVFLLFYPNLAGLPIRRGILRTWLPTWPF